LITLGIGLESGVMTLPQPFLSIATLFESLTVLRMMLLQPDTQRQNLQSRARTHALSLCLRIFRGVPDLERAGVCFLQDAMYLRGLRLIEQAAALDKTVLDRLAVGMCALEDLPDLQAPGIVSGHRPFKDLIFDPDLDSYILSFAQSEEKLSFYHWVLQVKGSIVLQKSSSQKENDKQKQHWFLFSQYHCKPVGMIVLQKHHRLKPAHDMVGTCDSYPLQWWSERLIPNRGKCRIY
jgi:hypothetical protein